MLSSELEICLNEAFQAAREARHEFMTVEHLLLALLDIPGVHEILKACDSNIAELRRQLIEVIDEQQSVAHGDHLLHKPSQHLTRAQCHQVMQNLLLGNQPFDKGCYLRDQ